MKLKKLLMEIIFVESLISRMSKFTLMSRYLPILNPKTQKAHHTRTHLSQMSHHLSQLNHRAVLSEVCLILLQHWLMHMCIYLFNSLFTSYYFYHHNTCFNFYQGFHPVNNRCGKGGQQHIVSPILYC